MKFPYFVLDFLGFQNFSKFRADISWVVNLLTFCTDYISRSHNFRKFPKSYSMFLTKQVFDLSIKIFTCFTSSFNYLVRKNIKNHITLQMLFLIFSRRLNLANDNFRDTSCGLNFKNANCCNISSEFFFCGN